MVSSPIIVFVDNGQNKTSLVICFFSILGMLFYKLTYEIECQIQLVEAFEFFQVHNMLYVVHGQV